MKKTKTRIIVIISSIVTIFVSIYSLSNTTNELNAHYKLKLIFEKNLSNENGINEIILFDNKSQNFILRGPSPFSPTISQYYHVPPILHIDEYDNIYVLLPGRIDVYNTMGNSILQFEFADSLNLDYYSWDEKGLYLFFNKNYSDMDYQIFVMSLLEGDTKKLNQIDSQLLNPVLLPPSSKKQMAQSQAYLRSISDINGVYYGIGWSTGDYTLLNQDNGRYIDPKKLLVLKFDHSYKDFYSGPLSTDYISLHPEIYEKYIYDNIYIESLFDDRVVCIGERNIYINKKGDIFLIGLKSNRVNRITESKNINPIEVKNPILFLAKLENE